MPVAEPLLSAAGVVAAVVAMLVDGRRAVVIASGVVALGLLPSVATTGAGPAVLVVSGAGIAAVLLGLLVSRAAQQLSSATGLNPLIPAFAPARQLFGPRSVRASLAALAVPVASWVSFNVPIGEVTTVRGLIFPMAYMWACGALRIVIARTVEDIAVGVAVVGLASAGAWLVRGEADPVPGAAVLASLAPVAAAVAGWLSGRHARRPQEAGA